MNFLKTIMELAGDMEDPDLSSLEAPAEETPELGDDAPTPELDAEEEPVKQKFTAKIMVDGEEVEKKVKAFSEDDIKAYFGDDFVSAEPFEAEEEVPAEEPTEEEPSEEPVEDEAPVQESLLRSVVAEATLGAKIQFSSYKAWKASLPGDSTFHKDAHDDRIERAQSRTKDFEGVAGTFNTEKNEGWIYKHYLKEVAPVVGGLSRLAEMAKRSSPDAFYAMAKKMYGADKVKSLKWPEVAAVAKENDVLIPPYLRTQKTGRGLFNLVPPDHADGKPAPKEEPKAEPKKETPKEEPKAVAKEYAYPQLSSASYSDWTEFYNAMKKQFGEFELKRVPHGPQRHGRFGIQEGEKLMVDAKTDRVMGVWEVTGGDKIPGRGMVAYGNGRLANEKQVAPKAAAKPEERRKGGSASKDEMKLALLDAASEMRDVRRDNNGAEWHTSTENSGKGLEISVRHWGEWEGDDGSGDYDHQDLAKTSGTTIGKILKQVEARHKSVAMSFSTGEKNWIYLRAE